MSWGAEEELEAIHVRPGDQIRQKDADWVTVVETETDEEDTTIAFEDINGNLIREVYWDKKLKVRRWLERKDDE